MPAYDLVPTPEFKRSFKRFAKKHPELRKATRTALETLTENPFAPKLRLHALRGELEGLQSISINYTYRITLILKIENAKIFLVGIGSHDEVY